MTRTTMPDEAVGLVASIRRTLRWLTIATVILYLALAAGAVKIYLDGREVHDSLCTFRSDLKTRVSASEQFLRNHPNGIPGIPAATLRQSADGQKRTIATLSSLNCPE